MLNLVFPAQLLVFFCVNGVVASDDDFSFESDELFDDFMVRVEGRKVLDGDFKSTSVLDCARKCTEWSECSSFFYNMDTMKCILHRLSYPYPFNQRARVQMLFSSPGMRYYRYSNASCPMRECYYQPRQLPGFCFTVFWGVAKEANVAREICARNMGRLAVVDTPVKYSWMKALIDTGFTDYVYVLGANRDATTGQFVWLNGNAVNKSEELWGGVTDEEESNEYLTFIYDTASSGFAFSGIQCKDQRSKECAVICEYNPPNV